MSRILLSKIKLVCLPLPALNISTTLHKTPLASFVTDACQIIADAISEASDVYYPWSPAATSLRILNITRRPLWSYLPAQSSLAPRMMSRSSCKPSIELGHFSREVSHTVV
ncbi:uncharacterized protein SCHCODRAFT_02705434 [Schizophyllum commune H4-8]|uniref:uncharacterized protein n=1 Tax=Schizophyllum commune (strain H4-8 / FGSC 9210) TaxID=578458 RepID=UPI00215E6273|nr:uncharacterized protein SCHCODRAFT_02705434 [Schizophyllum commune H4-8]KAI5886836.1 hypothetical protein SCHCODRAFT_02705434 [Schizophyllum commune H4-8]